jgi:DNA-binding transcriptional regulator YbjK
MTERRRSPHTRRRRGELRRERLLRAALSVIAERGTGAATHRAIAEAADVPVSTTTYYFASIDELLEEALLLFVSEEVARLRQVTERLHAVTAGPEEIATQIVAALEGQAGDGSPSQLAQFELYLEVNRRPALRDAASACLEAYTDVARAALAAAGAPDSERGARAFVALVDGFGLHELASGGADPDALRDALLTLFVAYTMDGWERRERLERPRACSA